MNATAALVIGGIFSVTMLAVALSTKAQTSNVLQSASGFATSIINAAVAPVTGTTPTPSFGSNGVNTANTQGG